MRVQMTKLGFAALLALGLSAPARAEQVTGGTAGDPVDGLTAQELALFEQGKARFTHDFTPTEGLGPTYNARNCAVCHVAPAVGGGENVNTNDVTHFGAMHQGRFLPLIEQGGPVRQKLSIAGDPEAPACHMGGDVVPSFLAEVITSNRHTPPVFGFGLLDAVSDEEILKYAGRKPFKTSRSVIGLPNWGTELEGLGFLQVFSFDATRTQPIGASRVGRFGWKAQTPTIFQFSTDPLNVELGISTPFFPRENTPNGGPVPPECKVAAHQPNDVGSHDSLLLTYFQAFLTPPARLPKTPQIAQGEAKFKAVGCADCHRQGLTTTKDYYMPMLDGTAHRVEALSGKHIEPWSDLLVHDMGAALDDHRIMGRASGRFWRTTPLWGLRLKTRFLHDGSATILEDAIAAHDGEGADSRDRYFALSQDDQDAVDAFLKSL